MRRPLQLLVGTGTLVILLGTLRVSIAEATVHHLIWDPIDKGYHSEGSAINCDKSET